MLQMLFMSPRNSLEGHLAVIEAASCNTWLIPSEGGNIDEILAQHPMTTFALPDLLDLLNEDHVEHYAYNKTYEEGRLEPCWVLHTSGSTGLPKPVTRYNSSTCATEAHRLCGPVDGRPLLINELIGSRVYMTFPLFHVSLHPMNHRSN
jgi:hypothetical protein